MSVDGLVTLILDPEGGVVSLALGAQRAGETPVPIPNTVVKPSFGDNTAFGGKIARRQLDHKA